MRYQASILVFLVSLCLAVSLASAQQTNSVAAVAAPTGDPSPAAAVGSVTVSPEGLVSLDFQDADIKNVLKVLAYKSNMNIVAGPEVTGTVTIQLNDVPWKKALEVVLSTYGYGYDIKGNIITVTTVENLKKRHEDTQMLADQEALITKTYVLSFSKASEVVESINKMKTSRGQVNFDQRTNALIVRDVQSNMDLIDEIIKTLDTPTPQVLIEAKIIETDFDKTENLGVDWTINLTASGAARPTIFPFTNQTNKFIVDKIPTDPNTSGSTSDFKYGTLDASGLSAALELLNQRTDTNVLSSPRIVTLDNQTAKITVGLKYPIPQYTYNQEQAKLQISGYDFLPIGIIFEVTPHVNNASLVTMDINPQISTIQALVKVDPLSTATIPEISTEEAKTKVMIRDGQTLVIAGLIKETNVKVVNKVPFLGDIPLIGQAFKKKNDSKVKTELMIFLTPHIITANSVASPTPAPPAGGSS